MIEEDEIMSELRQIRAELLCECGNDTDALFRMIKEQEDEERRRGRVMMSLPPRRPSGVRPDAA